jgi:hypothetical protein
VQRKQAHKDRDRLPNRVDRVKRRLDMRGLETLAVMEAVEHMTIARGAWAVHGVEEEAVRVGMEIDRSSLLPRHGRLMRTNSWEVATVVEEGGQETGCQADLGQEGGLAEDYQVDPEECDRRRRQMHIVDLWEIRTDLTKEAPCMARSSDLIAYWKACYFLHAMSIERTNQSLKTQPVRGAIGIALSTVQTKNCHSSYLNCFYFWRNHTLY